jgi:membrane protein DedA with SNARE-associated domain
MSEILIYLVIAIGSLLMMSYTVHMFVGGLVSQETEYFLIAAACVVVACVIGYMTWDVIQKRKGRK